MTKARPFTAFCLALLSAPAVSGTFTITSDIARCQMSSIVRGTCLTSHSDEPLAWRASLDCRMSESEETVALKLDSFTNIADSTMYTVQLTYPHVMPRIWYCAKNNGKYISVLGTTFSGQQQSSDCFWYAGENTQRP